MAEKKLSGAGLRGQSAGSTELCTVGKSGTGLTYRGYDITDLADNATFEEVAYLIFYGELPTAGQLDDYHQVLKANRKLPATLLEVLERIPADAHPMDVMRTGCSMLGNLEPEGDFSNEQAVANRLLGALPGIINYWYRFSHEGVRIDTDTDADSLAGHFLETLTGKKPSALHQRVMDVSLILYAEHEFNASTFTARVCASTLSDMHSCVTGAIGSLRGPLHGGANEAAMELIEKFTTADEASTGLLGMLERKEKIMGFGHAIYSTSDPRNVIIKQWAEKLANEVETPCCIRFHARSKKSCGMKKLCLLTRTSFTPRPITSWAFPRNCLHQYSCARGYRAGVPMSWSSAQTIVSFVPARITSAQSLGF